MRAEAGLLCLPLPGQLALESLDPPPQLVKRMGDAGGRVGRRFTDPNGRLRNHQYQHRFALPTARQHLDHDVKIQIVRLEAGKKPADLGALSADQAL